MIPPSRPSPRVFTVLGPATLVALAAGGCQTPFGEDANRSLRDSVLKSTQRELAEAEKNPARRVTERGDGSRSMNIKPELLPELEKMAGAGSYPAGQLPPDTDLLGQPTRTTRLSLQRAISTAINNNLNLQFSRLQPVVSEAQLVAAQAAFDWVVFSNLNWANNDQPRTSTTGTASPNVETNTQFATGLRRQLSTGGQFTVQQDLNYIDDRSPGSFTRPNPSSAVGITLQLDQPLLRGAGSDVALSDTRLARNAERNSLANLRRDLIRNVSDTERAYWQLARAVRDVQILQRLLERGAKTAEKVKAREKLDATPAQIADVTARIERRRAELLRAQSVLRQASDRLKGLINDPDAPVGSEILLIPADDAVDAPLEFSLFDLYTAAVTDRPEIEQAVLSIDDTSIRKVVADNARLPRLDLRLQTRLASLGDDPGPAYSDAFDGKFVDAVLGLVFEQPIGNRRAEAEYRRRTVERLQAVISYRNTVQQILLEVRQALISVTTQYKLIAQTRQSRLAASDVLRALQVENELNRGYTVERLDLELNRQELLSSAEREEVQALTDYNSSLADLYAAIGRTLERNQINFSAPLPMPFDPYSFDTPSPNAGPRPETTGAER